ncbi:chromosomal replication initiator protein DnaA [Thalassoporum mexicanum PCC 7367]|uniref:chromosomal replication initiator protein DnaA n=1 Tax=Thalassoporum mexicanum TaxID=3457544 RepID=UPI00029F8B9B|nr:chromosomal replication initiator protein DnaA [Pseudanabaena sp. PCC 7367]AFY68322.1 chromosomal replication initiator protein DnaA [Pseudanabaena sp. PCC 7367]
MDISKDTLWTMVLEYLEGEVSRPALESWIKTALPEELTPEKFVLRTPHSFARNWLFKYYYHRLKEVVAEILGYTVEVQILTAQQLDSNAVEMPEDVYGHKDIILLSDDTPTEITAAGANNLVRAGNSNSNGSDRQDSPSATNASNGSNSNGVRTGKINPKYTFSRFVVGATNRMAHAAALAVAESPGREFNPLFLCGGVGLGKTHLMQAIAHYRLEISTDQKIFYVSTEQFTNDLISAIRQDSMQAFREHYRDVDMILVDDIQFIEGKEYTQEEFFHTFNTLYESGKQIILASDRPPAQIPRLQERLCSRFSMGLIADVQVPDLETRMAILQKKAEYENLRIPSEVIHYIAASYTSNIRELEGALVRAVTYISISGLPMTVDNVSPVLNAPKEPVEIAPAQVVDLVAAYFEVEAEAMRGSSRKRTISLARQVAMFLMRQHTSLSLPKIGDELGGKDHTTVMYSCDKIAQQQEKDPEMAQALREISDRIYHIAKEGDAPAKSIEGGNRK